MADALYTMETASCGRNLPDLQLELRLVGSQPASPARPKKTSYGRGRAVDRGAAGRNIQPGLRSQSFSSSAYFVEDVAYGSY